MGVVESASRLFDLLASRDTTFTKCLKPGLSENQIRHIIAHTGVELPGEVIAFYSHFNVRMLPVKPRGSTMQVN